MVTPPRSTDLIDLQRRTLIGIIVFASLSVWIATLLAGAHFRALSIEVLSLWALVQAVCVAGVLLLDRTPGVSMVVVLGGLWLCDALAILKIGTPFFLYLLAVLSLATGVLLGWRIGGVVTLLATLGLAGLPGDILIPAQTLPVALLMWLMLFTGLLVFQSLETTLDIVLHYEKYAVEQMTEAREHRAELMRLAKALQEARYELERANVQLRHARDAAENARRLKAQFAANVSHELRTPINLIVGFSEIMVNSPETYGANLPSAYWMDLSTIYRNARHLQNLINDVLDISQIEAGRMAVVKEMADPRQVILEAADLVRDAIANKGLRFLVDVGRDLPRLNIDRVRIRQVILNLLGNAIRFTDQGAITLTTRLDGPNIVVRIQDTGIGFQPGDVQRAFEEFYQLEGSLSRRYGGSGLGLALSKQFVEMHQGRLLAESAGPGLGSTFTVALPLEPSSNFVPGAFPREHADGATGSAPAAAARQPARYFLVVDDDPTIAQLFERYSSRHRPIGAATIDEAQRMAVTIQPSAIVLDENVDEADFDILTRAAPLIRCPMPSGRRRMKLHGIADFLVKPISAEGLHQALQRLDRPIQTVLVIDDEQDIVRLYERILRNLSPVYQVRKAYGGLEGLDVMRSAPPDVVILDLLMPGMDGFGVLQHMKADPALADVPVILASAYGASDAISAVAHGALKLEKAEGFEPMELVRCVEALVDAITPYRTPAPPAARPVPAAS